MLSPRNRLVPLLAISAACSGGPVSVSGTLGGKSMNARDATSFAQLGTPPQLSSLTLFITDYSGACEQVLSGSSPRSSSVITLLARTRNGFDAGTFDMTGTDPAFLFGFDRFDSSCNDSPITTLQSGSFTLTRLDASGATGSFDVHLGTGEHVTASFTAAACTGTPSDAGFDGGGCP